MQEAGKIQVPPSQEYLQARVRGFIHSYPFSLPYRKHTEFVVYICDECVRAEAAWKAISNGHESAAGSNGVTPAAGAEPGSGDAAPGDAAARGDEPAGS